MKSILKLWRKLCKKFKRGSLEDLGPGWAFSDPFLMSTSLYRSHYHQWGRNGETGECKLIRIPGQNSNGVWTSNQDPKAPPVDRVRFTKRGPSVMADVPLN